MTTTASSASVPTPPSARLYGRIVEDWRARIISGEAGPGSGIPSERELEERYGVSRITVRRALDELVREKLIERRQGRRTVVLGPPVAPITDTVSSGFTDMLHLGRVTNARLLAFEWRIASAEIAGRLDLQEGDQVLHVARLRVRDEEPMFHSEVHLPRRVGLLIDRSMLERAPILNLMIEAGIGVVSSQQTMSAAPCPDWLAPLLRVEAGSPTFRIDRLVRDAEERPVQMLTGYSRWDRFSYRIETTHLEPSGSAKTGVRSRSSGLVAL